MNAYIVCLTAVLSAGPSADTSETVYKPVANPFTVRAQEPTYYEEPVSQAAPVQSPIYSPPPMVNQYPPQGVGDPFMGPPPMYTPGPAVQFAFGPNGPQPLRWGFTNRLEAGVVPKSKTNNNTGRMGIFELDIDAEYTAPTALGSILSFTQQYDMRLFSGPNGPLGLTGNAHRFGWDIEWATPADRGPWSFHVAANPSFATDFERSFNSDTWFWDGRAAAYYRHSPHWLLAFGAGFWDRVNDRVIPYAGVLWTPNPRWEFQAMFPESKVSFLIGNFGGVTSWIYMRGEYHKEAYQVELGGGGTPRYQDQLEIEDWRLMWGIRSDGGIVAGFAEIGLVMGRSVAFKFTPDFDLATDVLVRGGIQY